VNLSSTHVLPYCWRVGDKWREGTIKIPFSDETPARNYWRKIRAARLLALEVPSLLTDGQRQMHFGSLLQVSTRLCGGNRNLNCCTSVKAYSKLYSVPVLLYKTHSQNVSRATGTLFGRYPYQNHSNLPKLLVNTSHCIWNQTYPSPPLQSDKPLFKEKKPKPSKHIPWPPSNPSWNFIGAIPMCFR